MNRANKILSKPRGGNKVQNCHWTWLTAKATFKFIYKFQFIIKHELKLVFRLVHKTQTQHTTRAALLSTFNSSSLISLKSCSFLNGAKSVELVVEMFPYTFVVVANGAVRLLPQICTNCILKCFHNPHSDTQRSHTARLPLACERLSGTSANTFRFFICIRVRSFDFLFSLVAFFASFMACHFSGAARTKRG